MKYFKVFNWFKIVILPADEPVFMLKASDHLSLSTLRHYYGQMFDKGIPFYTRLNFMQVLEKFEDWQTENLNKYPPNYNTGH